jgi:hypothetical protein
VVRGAAQHRAIDMTQVRGRFGRIGDAAVDATCRSGPLLLQPVRPVVAQRRDLAVLLRRQALQPGIARMHHEHLNTAAAPAHVSMKAHEA